MLSAANIKKTQTRLLKWYHRQKREMPWRENRNPYRIFVSEFMLQQTQVKTVIPYFNKWMKSFPTVKKLAAASESKVLKHWEGLGYYSRARNLLKSAKQIQKSFDGKVPNSFDEIMELPGVGRYTAGAVLSIAFDKKVPVLDGNVKRVLSRLMLLKENGSNQKSETRLWMAMENLLPEKNCGDFNQAFMELGATVCLPQNPLCKECPLKQLCEAKKSGKQELFPPPKASTTISKIQLSAAVIFKKDSVYIQKRKAGGLMGGLWEFPGGKMEKGETEIECLRREIKEELGINIRVGEKLVTHRHSYTRFRVTLNVFNCKIHSGKLDPKQCDDWKWVKPEELDQFPFPAANVKIIKLLNK
ncbi:MAG: A/G-specific adenine glycosylase [Nitrospinota bacterium]